MQIKFVKSNFANVAIAVVKNARSIPEQSKLLKRLVRTAQSGRQHIRLPTHIASKVLGKK
jgi:hypothetical protein